MNLPRKKTRKTGNRTFLTERWFPLKPIKKQIELIKSPARFKVVAAGRRSGKTERSKRNLVKTAFAAPGTFGRPRFFASAPTYAQAKGIYWEDLKALVPRRFVKNISEAELTIRLVTGTDIVVLGLDKPERMEGMPWDGGVITEAGNIKPSAWGEHIRPALSDRKAWCWIEGVPEGRNHFYEMYKRAAWMKGWEAFHWVSSEVLDEDEIADAKEELDDLTFAQEYEAKFVNFKGRVYSSFVEENKLRLKYNPEAPLIFCFDFNVDPGVAVICQEMDFPDGNGQGTGCIGEVHIPNNSTTLAVCRKLEADWGTHEGPIYMYGDATGGNRGSAKVSGSDWDIIREFFKPIFEDRLVIRVPAMNPRERARINAVNSRSCSISGVKKLMIDPAKCPKLVDDMEGVTYLEGGSGEIDKKKDLRATHISDALGYYIVYEFPVSKDYILRPTGPVIFGG